MKSATANSGDGRIVCLIDMDCFYCQVEERLYAEANPEYVVGREPAVVLQSTGSLPIAVNYAARNAGVKRGSLHLEEARKICPNLRVFRIPLKYGKSSLTRYRDASERIFSVLREHFTIVEKASVDEVFVDLTPDLRAMEDRDLSVDETTLHDTVAFDLTFAEWRINEDSKGLVKACEMVSKARQQVKDKTGYECSAGISINKMLAKYICALNKPNKQTVLPTSRITKLLAEAPIAKIRNLGGKLGALVTEEFNITFMREILDVPLVDLIELVGGNQANRLRQMAQGNDNETIQSKSEPKSLGSSKMFRGSSSLKKMADVKRWCQSLLLDLDERAHLDKVSNKRMARSLTLQLVLQLGDGKTKQITKTMPCIGYDVDKTFKQLVEVMKSVNESKTDEDFSPSICSMFIQLSRFEHVASKANDIRAALNRQNMIHHAVNRLDPSTSAVKAKPVAVEESPKEDVLVAEEGGEGDDVTIVPPPQEQVDSPVEVLMQGALALNELSAAVADASSPVEEVDTVAKVADDVPDQWLADVGEPKANRFNFGKQLVEIKAASSSTSTSNEPENLAEPDSSKGSPTQSTQQRSFYKPPPKPEEIDWNTFECLPDEIKEEYRHVLGLNNNAISVNNSNDEQAKSIAQKPKVERKKLPSPVRKGKRRKLSVTNDRNQLKMDVFMKK